MALSVPGCSSRSWANVARSSRNASSTIPVAAIAESDRAALQQTGGIFLREHVSAAAARRISTQADDSGGLIVRVTGVGGTGPVQFQAVRSGFLLDRRQPAAETGTAAVGGRPQRGPVGDAQVGLVQQRLAGI